MFRFLTAGESHGRALVAIVEGGDDVATEVIAMERVRKVIFTGSSAGGRAVARLCGEHFKPCVLELGGSGAAIVCDDADIALAARGIAWSAFAARGGSCVGTKRVFVHEAIAGAFAAALEYELLRLRPGDPADPASDLPFPVERRDTERLRAIVANALAEGGTIFTPGGRVRAAEDLDARLPVVIFDAHTHMRVMREEAPVLAVRTVRTIDQAVRETNESCFGLSASVWSREGSVAREIARQLYTGIVWINDASAGEPGYPWGGVKSSGWGRIFGRAGIAELTNVKVVSQDRRHSSTPKFWWFPYSREKLELLQDVNTVLYGRRWRRLPHLLSAVWRYLAGRWTAGKGAVRAESGGPKKCLKPKITADRAGDPCRDTPVGSENGILRKQGRPAPDTEARGGDGGTDRNRILADRAPIQDD